MHRLIFASIVGFTLAAFSLGARLPSAVEVSIKKVKLDNYFPNDTLSATLSSDGKFFLQVNIAGEGLCWQLKADRGTFFHSFRRNVEEGQKYSRASFSRSNRYLVLDSTINRSNHGKIALIRLADAKIIQEFKTRKVGEGWENSAFAFSPSEKYLAYISDDSESVLLSVYDVENNQHLKSFSVGNKDFSSLVFYNDKILATKDYTFDLLGSITEWNIDTGKSICRLEPSKSETDRFYIDKSFSTIPSILFSQDANFIVTHSNNIDKIGLWDVKQKTIIYKKNIGDLAPSMLFVPHEQYEKQYFLLGGSGITKLNIASRQEHTVNPFGSSLVDNISISQDKEIIIASNRKNLAILDGDLQTLSVANINDIYGFSQSVFIGNDSANNKRFYLNSDSGHLSLWTILNPISTK